MIVPRPWASLAVAPLMLVTLTKKVSFGSGVMSPLTVTVNVKVVFPAAIVWPMSEWRT